ncbi:MAG: hypothetical protein UDG94_10845 [Peptococcaceae bacterium]|nr:hypothetical protein [Peptococcaceae bacterium]
MDGFFGDAFDFDGSGDLDAMELAADYAMFAHVMNYEAFEERVLALAQAGISLADFRWMNHDEQIQFLVNANLNPEAFEDLME